MKVKSNIEGIKWPGVQVGRVATLMALQRQFEETQWWPTEQIIAHQFEQLTALANHATSIPFHANSLKEAGFVKGQAMTLDIWKRIPVLTRSDVRALKEQLHSSSYPVSFGKSSMAYSGGSTGVPVGVKKSEMDAIMWEASNLRELLWNNVDESKDIANFRGFRKESREQMLKWPDTVIDGAGIILQNWGPPITYFTQTGRMGLVEPDLPLSDQVNFILRNQPTYIIARPAGLRLLLLYFREHNLEINSVKSVWTMSEVVDDTLRDLCLKIFKCPIISNYTSNETGYIALQCPVNTNYHIISEAMYVEVVDEQGNYCNPGEIGKVLVTPLHNFAMPLIRYEIGDEAEVGPSCSCGRGLPSLTRIVGRAEDYFILKNGERRRVDFDHYKICDIEAIKEFQLIQKTRERLELRLVTTRPLNENELSRIRTVKENSIARDLQWDIVFVNEIKRTAAGKLLQFISEVNS